MDTNQKGKLTELKILTYITELGYPVSIPFGDKDRYDQIWDINGTLIKIQVKTSHLKNENSILFKCKSSSNGKDHKYTKDEIDYFATWWDNQVYLIPVQECSTEKTLWFTKPKNGCTKCAMAEKYLASEVLKNI